MTTIREHSGDLDASGRRFGIVAARFNERLVTSLIAGAVDCLRRHGAAEADLELVRVPGAFELPLALQVMARTGRWHALIALAVVIRGETPHFDLVCSQCASGVSRVSLEHGLPIGFGVLTCDDSAQAQERAGGKAGNKGWEAALAAIEMSALLPSLGDR